MLQVTAFLGVTANINFPQREREEWEKWMRFRKADRRRERKLDDPLPTWGKLYHLYLFKITRLISERKEQSNIVTISIWFPLSVVKIYRFINPSQFYFNSNLIGYYMSSHCFKTSVSCTSGGYTTRSNKMRFKQYQKKKPSVCTPTHIHACTQGRGVTNSS